MTIAAGSQALAADVNAIKTMTEAHKTRHQTGGADEVVLETVVYSASDTLRQSNDTERTTASAVYVKKKECLINAGLPACRIKFTLGNENVADTYGKIYKNGVAIGIERVNHAGDPSEEFSEDFTGFVAGDLIQIYLHADGANVAHVYYFRFYYDITRFTVTNQDP